MDQACVCQRLGRTWVCVGRRAGWQINGLHCVDDVWDAADIISSFIAFTAADIQATNSCLL